MNRQSGEYGNMDSQRGQDCRGECCIRSASQRPGTGEDNCGPVMTDLSSLENIVAESVSQLSVHDTAMHDSSVKIPGSRPGPDADRV